MAVVTLGIYMAARGSAFLSVKGEKMVQSWWSMISWLATTFLFLLSGVIIGNVTVHHDSIGEEEYGLLIAFFLLVILIRFMSSLVFYPALKWVGQGLTLNQFMILALSGLRNAMSLALANVLHHEPDFEDDLKHHALFLTYGIVFLT
jgi:hypothetical protein